MPSFEEVEESMHKGKRSTFRHKCANFAISTDGTSLMNYKKNKYDSNKKPASTVVTIVIKSDKSESEAYDSPPAKKICLSPPTKKTSLSPPTFQLTPIQIISDALIIDVVITDRELRFKPPTKGFMIINSSPLDIHRNEIVHPKISTARMFNRTAAPKPKNIRKIVADGNCLFRAFSFCLTDSESHHLTVRRIICDYMEFYPSTWQPLVGTRTVSE
uniref:OTU domain-containing protein n=1 Tax=Plectus sambesii TaxID=2011161 RepID=A0A914X2M4_9BILA